MKAFLTLVLIAALPGSCSGDRDAGASQSEDMVIEEAPQDPVIAEAPIDPVAPAAPSQTSGGQTSGQSSDTGGSAAGGGGGNRGLSNGGWGGDVLTSSVPSSDAPDLESLLPWPPPVASGRLVLDNTAFRAALPEKPSIEQVSTVLERALRNADYQRIGYLGVPGSGFALVTGLEQIDANGWPLEGPERWMRQIAVPEGFSIPAFLKALLFAPEGRFRVLLFVVTDRPFNEDPDKDLTEAVLANWARRGANDLPATIGSQAFGPSHKVTVLIYEFVKANEGDEPRVNTRDPRNVRSHLSHLSLAGLGVP